MILDRIFGVIAAVAFALGVAVHVALVTGRVSAPDFTDPLLILYGVCALVTIVYALSDPQRRNNLGYGSEVDFFDIFMSLPAWAMAIGLLLTAYTAAVIIVAYSGAGFDIAPGTLRAQPGTVSVSAIVPTICFVIAAYCFVGIRPKAAFSPDQD